MHIFVNSLLVVFADGLSFKVVEMIDLAEKTTKIHLFASFLPKLLFAQKGKEP
jgi:hypothetical protein